jgi:hypothetical protein
MKITFLLFIITFSGYAQFHKTDSIDNFYVIKNKLVWQNKYYFNDIDDLNDKLKSENFTSGLDILKFGTSALTDLFTINGNNLPQYARHDFKAFLIIDVYHDTFRITIKDITFPDFVENIYYNGMRQNSRTGSLENYILRQDGNIKRNNSNINVLNSFDNSFLAIFDIMGESVSD